MHARFNPTATLFPLVIVGLLAGMTFWLELAARPPSATSDGKSRHDPDYIIEKLTIRRFDPEGFLQHTLRADSMRHYPDDDSTVVLAPHLTYHRQPPTLVTAREARLDGAGKHVELIGDVRVTRSGLDGQPGTVLITERLDAFPDDEIAASNAPVTILQGRSNISGSGLNINNKTAISILEGPVYGIFHRTPGTATTAAQPAAGTQPKPKPKPQPKPKG